MIYVLENKSKAESVSFSCPHVHLMSFPYPFHVFPCLSHGQLGRLLELMSAYPDFQLGRLFVLAKARLVNVSIEG